MSNIDKQALREAAERATESDWIVDAHEGWHAVIPVADAVNGNYIIAEFQGPESKHNCDFVAAAKPVTVLALLDELEVATYACNGWQRKFAEADERLQAAEKRIAELSASHGNLREAMAGIHNTIRGEGACTPLAAILNASKRAYEESAAAAGKGD